MTYPLINLLEEIRLRIQNAIDNGSLECREIFIGDFEQIRKMNDYPICVIGPVETNPEAECMQWGITENARLGIAYIIARTADNVFKLYDSTLAKGPLVELGKILNYLDLSRSTGKVDLTMNNTAYNLPVPSVRFDYSNSDIIKMVITVTVKTAEFIRGQR